MIKIGIIIPSNNPRDMFEYFIPTLEHLVHIKLEIQILTNLQFPWEADLIDIAQKKVEKFFPFRYIFTGTIPEKAAKMCQLRYDAMSLWSEANYYLYADDNFIFQKGTSQYQRSSGERYWEVGQYMERFSDCGMVMCEGSLGGSIQKWSIAPIRTGLIATTRGLLFRNIGLDILYPKDSLTLAGTLEESIPAFGLVEKGYFLAKQFNNPTRHVNKIKHSESLPPNAIHNPTLIANNCQRYIRERWQDSTWTHEARRIPKGALISHGAYPPSNRIMDFA